MGPATAWAIANAVRLTGLGDCPECGEVVYGGDECSECLEEDGVAVHDRCCQLEQEHQ